MTLCNCCFDNDNYKIIRCKNELCVYIMCEHCYIRWYYTNNKSNCPHCNNLNVTHLKNRKIKHQFIGNTIKLIIFIEMVSFTIFLISSIIFSLKIFKNDLIKLLLLILFLTLTFLVLKIIKILNNNPILYNYIIHFF